MYQDGIHLAYMKKYFSIAIYMLSFEGFKYVCRYRKKNYINIIKNKFTYEGSYINQ